MKSINLQDLFLNQAKKEKIAVTVCLNNGFQFKGVVKGFDAFTVVIDCEGKQSLIYKHSISTVTPSKSITVLDNTNE